MNALSYQNNRELLKVFLRLNGIIGAFVFRDGSDWIVYEGNPETLCGFHAGAYKRKRDAIAVRNAINALIASVS